MENHKLKRNIARGWIQKNPRIFSTLLLTGSMVVLFSRPLYDAFIRDDLLPPKTMYVVKK